MNLAKELQDLNNRLDKSRRKLLAAEQRSDSAMIAQFKAEVDAVSGKIAKLKGQQGRQLSDKGGVIKALPFSRPLTKAEQADMGKLKKSVRGLVVVHPLTALGREIGVTAVTGFAPASF